LAACCEVNVKWQGPADPGDLIFIVEKIDPPFRGDPTKFPAGIDKYMYCEVTPGVDEIKLAAPDFQSLGAKNYEIGYWSLQKKRVLGTIDVSVDPCMGANTSAWFLARGGSFTVVPSTPGGVDGNLERLFKVDGGSTRRIGLIAAAVVVEIRQLQTIIKKSTVYSFLYF